jgi:hypothetical protein
MKSAQTHHFMACFQFKQVKVFKTLHFGPMHNLSKCRNETHPLMLPQQRSPSIKRNSTVPGFLWLSGVQAVQIRVHSLPTVTPAALTSECAMEAGMI